jgi:hypothetical protein
VAEPPTHAVGAPTSAHPQGYPHPDHSPSEAVDSGPEIGPMFVDKRVDPPVTRPIP